MIEKLIKYIGVIKMNKIKQKSNLLICLSMLTVLFAVMFISCGCSATGNNHVNEKEIKINTDLSKLELKKAGELSVAIASDYPPFESFKSVQPVGLDVDIAYQICHDLNLGLAFNPDNFNNVINRVVEKNNDCAISTVTITEERSKLCDFSIPYFQDTKCAVASNDSGINESNLETILSDPNKTIVYKSGTTAKDFIDKHYPNCKLVDADTNDKCMKVLQGGQADVFIVDKYYCDTKLPNGVSVFKNYEEVEKFGIAINKDCPNLKAAINEVLKARLEDGTIENMINENLK